MHKVVRPFRYSEDGINSTLLNVGDERNFGSLTSGLVTGGFVEPIRIAVDVSTVEPVPAPAEAPADAPRQRRTRRTAE